jgi:hypothetical protein
MSGSSRNRRTTIPARPPEGGQPAPVLRYGSRRHDAARCLMLFGQRLPSRRFNVLDTELLATGELRPSIINLMRLDLDLL